MTAFAFADLLQARPGGAGKWWKWQPIADCLAEKLLLEQEERAIVTLYHPTLDQVRTWRAEAERREARAKALREEEME